MEWNGAKGAQVTIRHFRLVSLHFLTNFHFKCNFINCGSSVLSDALIRFHLPLNHNTCPVASPPSPVILLHPHRTLIMTQTSPVVTPSDHKIWWEIAVALCCILPMQQPCLMCHSTANTQNATKANCIQMWENPHCIFPQLHIFSAARITSLLRNAIAFHSSTQLRYVDQGNGGIWRRVTLCLSTNVSDEPNACPCRAQETALWKPITFPASNAPDTGRCDFRLLTGQNCVTRR